MRPPASAYHKSQSNVFLNSYYYIYTCRHGASFCRNGRSPRCFECSGLFENPCTNISSASLHLNYFAEPLHCIKTRAIRFLAHPTTTRRDLPRLSLALHSALLVHRISLSPFTPHTGGLISPGSHLALDLESPRNARQLKALGRNSLSLI